MIFNDFIKDDLIPTCDGQVASGSASLPDPVVLETEEEKLEREQNECEHHTHSAFKLHTHSPFKLLAYT